MTELDTRILAALSQANALTVPEICRDIDGGAQAVRLSLGRLKAAGHVVQHIDFFSLSGKAKSERMATA